MVSLHPELRYGVTVALQILVLSVQVRILVSQQISHKELIDNDLWRNNVKAGMHPGYEHFSLYDACMVLCKEKKCIFSNLQLTFITYRQNSMIPGMSGIFPTTS